MRFANSLRVVMDLYWDVPTEVPWVPTNQCTSRSAIGHGGEAIAPLEEVLGRMIEA